ncbi:MAG: hypothetical protein PHO18_06000 [Synergistaceae bacterium]|nr:hypothetical protein [Synergistaceae bacterium]
MMLTSKIDDVRNMSLSEKKELFIFAAFFIFFTALALWSMNNFITLLNISEPMTDIAPGVISPAGTSKDAAKIEDLEPKYRDYIKMRTYSSQMVALAEAVDRYPIANAAEELAARSVVKEDVLEEIPEIIPIVTIKALVVMSGEGVATLDIEGERPGLIVSRGTVFGGGKGRIISIDSGGVSWKWADKKYRTDL